MLDVQKRAVELIVTQKRNENFNDFNNINKSAEVDYFIQDWSLWNRYLEYTQEYFELDDTKNSIVKCVVAQVPYSFFAYT